MSHYVWMAPGVFGVSFSDSDSCFDVISLVLSPSSALSDNCANDEYVQLLPRLFSYNKILTVFLFRPLYADFSGRISQANGFRVPEVSLAEHARLSSEANVPTREPIGRSETADAATAPVEPEFLLPLSMKLLYALFSCASVNFRFALIVPLQS
jgi:hypothetical protein